MRPLLLSLALASSEADAAPSSNSARVPVANLRQFCEVPENVSPEALATIEEEFSLRLAKNVARLEIFSSYSSGAALQGGKFACKFISQFKAAIVAVRDHLEKTVLNSEIFYDAGPYQAFLADLNQLDEMRERMILDPDAPYVPEKNPFTRLEDNLLSVELPQRPWFTLDLTSSSDVDSWGAQGALQFLKNSELSCGTAFEEYMQRYGALPDLSTKEGSQKWNAYLLKTPENPDWAEVDFLATEPFAFEGNGKALVPDGDLPACGAYSHDVPSDRYAPLVNLSPAEHARRHCTDFVDDTKAIMSERDDELKDFTGRWFDLELEREIADRINLCVGDARAE